MAGTPHVPRCLGVDEQASVLALSHHAAWGRPLEAGDLGPVVTALGTIHARAIEVALRADLSEVMKPLGTQPTPTWVVDARAWVEFAAMSDAIANGGTGHVSLGDLNSQHLLRESGSPVLCDLETFRLGVPVQVDLLSLGNLLSRPHLSMSVWLKDVCEHYAAVRRTVVGRCVIDADVLTESVRQLAAACGRPH